VTIDARDSMRFVETTRERARSDVGLAWLAVALYSAFVVASVALGGGGGQGKFFWVLAAPIVALAAFGWAFIDGRERGVEAPRLGLIGIPFGLLTLAFALGALCWYMQLPVLAQFGPPTVVSAGYIAIGLHRRLTVMVLVGFVVVVVAATFALLSGGELLQAGLGLAYVFALLLARVGWRVARRKPS
jgi:hypothetical protein